MIEVKDKWLDRLFQELIVVTGVTTLLAPHADWSWWHPIVAYGAIALAALLASWSGLLGMKFSPWEGDGGGPG